METEMLKVETPLGWLAYRQRGEGRPFVVCIHGFCQSSAYWAPTIAHLGAAGAMAIAVDLPGFASSANAPGPYSMEAYADLLAAVLDKLGVERAIVIGGSMGGVVAQHFALRHPDRLDRLVLVATGARTPDPSGAMAKADAIAAKPWTEDDVAKSVAGFFHRQVTDEERSRFGQIMRSASRPAAAEAARSNAGSNTIDRLANISAPVLIVQGGHDRGRTPEHGAMMAELIPNARLTILAHSGHTPQLEEPDALHDVLDPFIFAKVAM